ncbi:alpha/beta fold hydrolase [Thalassotalea maritima]|uniref:alpha/beta hydrolase n=1 Tax=Thalassotalea maritima TaxID=3242416 RepID=UPI003527A666
MRNYLSLMLTVSLTASALAYADNEALYTNETPITFKANSGETTDAIDGHFFVPENRNNASSRNIRINYVRFPATTDKKGPPIVYLAGGPGGSGIGTAKWRRFPLFEALRAHGDVIALDQRGTGASEQADYCVSDVTLDHSSIISKVQLTNSYQQAAQQCFAKWQQQGVDIYGYTTVQNALDINDLRQHLGAEKITLWGISYGSHLAMSAVKLFPEHIDKVIIASAEGLDQTVKLPAQNDAYFTKVQSIINQQPLKQQVPDLAAMMRRVHASLDNKPVRVKPTYQDGSNNDILLQSVHLKMLASMMIADPNQYVAMLIEMYRQLDQGNTELITQIISRGIFKDEPIGFKLMSLAMDVASGVSTQRLSLIQKQAKSAILEDYLNFPMPMLNNIDSKLDLGSEFRQKPTSDVPTLLLTGSLDGRTYPQEQSQAVSNLTNVTQIMVENAGHNLFLSSPDVLKRMQAFLSNGPVDNSPIILPVPVLAMPQ